MRKLRSVGGVASLVMIRMSVKAGQAHGMTYSEHGAFTPAELADAGQWAAQALQRASQTGTTQRRSA
jgi:hypothetical protein